MSVNQREEREENKKQKIFILIGVVMLAVLCVTIFFLFKEGKDFSSKENILMNLLPTTENSFSENDIGTISFYQTDADHIVTSENGVMFVDNEILIVANDNAKYGDIENIARSYNAEIVGWIEQTGDYQLKFNQNYSKTEIEQIALSFKENALIQDAYVNFAFEIKETKTESSYGFIYGDEWEKDLQDPYDCLGKSWGFEAINTLEAWEVLNTHKNDVKPVKVGLIDMGFDEDHEDFGFVKTFYNVENDHGTHVTGIFAAKANNENGICGIYPYGDGNLYGVSYVGMCEKSENKVTSVHLKIAYAELILRNVKVINHSIAFKYAEAGVENFGPKWDYEVVDYMESNAYILGDFLDRLLDMGYDFVLVSGAGNDSNRNDGVIYDSKYAYWTTVISEEDYPEVYNRIIVVGAVNSDFNICYFSNGGDRVDIYAPGDVIFSTVPNNGYEKINSKGTPWSGTSMAAPHVSGVAAMMWSVNPNLTGAQVKRIVCVSRNVDYKSCDVIDAYLAVKTAANMSSSFESSTDENGAILGWVVSAENVNTKVKNATVTIINKKNSENYITTTTDSNGYFEFIVPDGTYSLLSIEAEHYENYVWSNGNQTCFDTIVVKNNEVTYLDDWVKMTPEYSNADILGIYKGSYFANQGETGLTLIVYNEEARYKAVFNFYNLPGRSNAKSGSYYMDVSYDIDTGEYYFKATDWINQPIDYETLDLCGKLNGEILSGVNPTSFSVVKDTKTTDGKISLEEMPLIAHDSYKDNEGDSTVFNLGADGLTQCDDGVTFSRYGNTGVDGSKFYNGFEVWIARWNYTDEISWASATFDIGGGYKTLTGKTNLIQSYNTHDFDTTIYFYDGNRLLASYRLTNEDYIKNISVDVRGVNQLKLYVKDNLAASGGTSFALYDMFLE